MRQPRSGDPVLIGIDWGTTSLRAYLLAEDGAVLERTARASGILNVPDGNFEDVLTDVCGDWLARWPELHILMCGMIGSRQGWREAPYLERRAGPEELAAGLVTMSAARHPVHIIPGLQSTSFSGGPDVMRGEETILVGAMAEGAPGDGYYCLPGTHSKWVHVNSGRIRAFSTFLTGELYDTMCRRSILSALIEQGECGCGQARNEAFLRGVDLAAADGGLLQQLFSIRARALTGSVEEGTVGAMLSGLLIGSELVSIDTRLRDTRGGLVLVASGPIVERYQAALGHLGHEAEFHDAEAACISGLLAVARHADFERGTAGAAIAT